MLDGPACLVSSNDIDRLRMFPICLLAALAIEVGVERNFVVVGAIKRGGLGTTNFGVFIDDKGE